MNKIKRRFTKEIKKNNENLSFFKIMQKSIWGFGFPMWGVTFIMMCFFWVRRDI